MANGFDVAREGDLAVITVRLPGKVNKINAEFGIGLAAAFAETSGATGVLLLSGHKDFCVGADLDMIYGVTDPAVILDLVRDVDALFRRMETSGIPVACVLAGSALGGGFELALACHYRVVVEDPRVSLGLPEVNLGVIPGAGGTQRLPRLIGIQPALDLLLQAKLVRGNKAVAAGLAHAAAPTVEAAVALAKGWLAETRPKSSGARQPWDRPDFTWPGVAPTSADARNTFMAASAMVYKKTAGVFPAAEALLAVVQEGSRLTFDGAVDVEARAFARLATSGQAKDMMRIFWYHRTAAEKHEGLPAAPRETGIRKVAILGAGMMGAGLAGICAQAGYEVVLRDIAQPALDAGMAHVVKGIGERLKHKSADERAVVVARVRASLAGAELAGADLADTDLVIEAVFENVELKHRIIREVEAQLGPSAIFASNTSALPITLLAEASVRRKNFVGLHFFSPVEQMPLLEIIRGEHTDEATVARCLGFCRSIQKLPIVVNDGYGFFTTRVFSAYILEGAQCVAEGYDPVLVDWAARVAGMVVPPLQVFDEVTLRLGDHALSQAEAFRPGVAGLAGAKLVKQLVGAGRVGRAHGAGFYDYKEGRREGIWSGLAAFCAPRVGGDPVAQVRCLSERLLLAQVAETLRAVVEGVVTRPQDADVGAVFGIGFAPNTGGPLSYVDRRGPEVVYERLKALAQQHGERFLPAVGWSPARLCYDIDPRQS
ncbi:MAG: 3-hydroxyacyl-CoA dehydrogenase [Myxococcales bacterium]|nr:3-hydroxyacyl-CoA dehydrogenase [Myxococcales bacterium]